MAEKRVENGTKMGFHPVRRPYRAGEMGADAERILEDRPLIWIYAVDKRLRQEGQVHTMRTRVLTQTIFTNLQQSPFRKIEDYPKLHNG